MTNTPDVRACKHCLFDIALIDGEWRGAYGEDFPCSDDGPHEPRADR